MIIYDYVGDEPEGAVRAWRDGQQTAQRAQIDQKLGSLRTAGLELLPGLIAGPLSVKGKKIHHIYKLQIGGKIRLRPLLCRGPADPNSEITLLVGAAERDFELTPPNVTTIAERRRKEIIDNEKLRKLYRYPEDELGPLVQG